MLFQYTQISTYQEHDTSVFHGQQKGIVWFLPGGQSINFSKILHWHGGRCLIFRCDVASKQKYWQKGADKCSQQETAWQYW